MLLSLEGDQLLDVVILNGRQLDKARKYRLAGNGIVNPRGFADTEPVYELGDRNPDLRQPGHFRRGISKNGCRIILADGEPP